MSGKGSSAIVAGAAGVVLVATTFKVFDLDRFFVPKELLLHALAAITALILFGKIRAAIGTRVDLLLLGFLALSVVSAALAQNRWVAFRAVAITASSILLFWSARVSPSRPVLAGVAVAVVLAAATSLLQAYGVDLAIFSENRSPGGTLGNRNFVAHAIAFGFPILLFFAATARRVIVPYLGVTIATAALVLTRSRGGWLAAGIVGLIFISRPTLRFAGALLFAGFGVAAAVLIPNTLHWRSDNPYLQSVQNIAEFEHGSGRGRLVQYTRSMVMAAHHPLLGVGPGNWPVEYPDYAARRDPSMNDSEAGMTFNPWPSSDWIAYASERGVAVVLLALAFLGLAFGGSADANTTLALLGVIAAAVLAGAFDAVLLLPVPAFLVWTSIGALGAKPEEPRRSMGAGTMALALVIVVAAAGAVRSGGQLAAMELYDSQPLRAARVDPGNYRIQLRAARIGTRNERCEHARAAHALFPSAEAARRLEQACRK